MTSHPLAISVSPSTLELSQGSLSTVQKITVTNAGTDSITVHSAPMAVLQTAGGCGVGKANPHWMTISRIGKLAPGQSRVSTVIIHAPSGYNGDIAAVFSGKAASHITGDGGTVEASVAAQFIIHGHGSARVPMCHAPKAIPPVTHGLLTLRDVLIALGIVVVLAIVAAIIGRRIRQPRPPRWINL